MALAGVNSINWARIMAQIVYYFTSAVALGAPHRPVSFTVPTGNFGDIFAGYVAARMGLPVDRLVVATNVNDILSRVVASGRYQKDRVVPTTSPSMDIQVSSNFERLLFEVYGRDSGAIRALMDGLAQSGAFTVGETELARIRQDFDAGHSDEAQTSACIARTLAETGELVDPHTAVGLEVASRSRGARPSATPMITLATAHPAKFPDAVSKASGRVPALPDRLSDLHDREERYSVVENDISTVEKFIESRARMNMNA